MAFKEITLQPVVSRRKSPYVVLSLPQVHPALDLKIKAGHDLDIPNHWELVFLVAYYIADANVANRRLEGYMHEGNDGVASYVSRDSFRTDNITANQSKYLILRRCSNLSGLTDDGAFTMDMLPGSWRFLGDDLFYLYTFSEQVGDLITVELTFRWLNWELGLEDPRATTPGSSPAPEQTPKSFWECLGL